MDSDCLRLWINTDTSLTGEQRLCWNHLIKSENTESQPGVLQRSLNKTTSASKPQNVSMKRLKQNGSQLPVATNSPSRGEHVFLFYIREGGGAH